jgi:hypothetical protein
MPHPRCEIVLDLELNGQNLHVQAVLPDILTGIFKWKGRQIDLQPGINKFLL